MPHRGYNTSYEKAVSELRRHCAPHDAAERTGAVYDEGRFEISYFGKLYTIRLPGCDFAPEELSLGEKILILHYLLSQGALEESPPLATFEGLRGGMFYFQTFKKRGPDRVLNDFRDDPYRLEQIAETMGWGKGDNGDVSIVIPVLPLISLTVAYYVEDEEFPPEVRFLFRKDIPSLLPLEDIAALGGFAATRLVILKTPI